MYLETQFPSLILRKKKISHTTAHKYTPTELQPQLTPIWFPCLSSRSGKNPLIGQSSFQPLSFYHLQLTLRKKTRTYTQQLNLCGQLKNKDVCDIVCISVIIINAGSYFNLQKPTLLLSEICLFGEATQLFQRKSTMECDDLITSWWCCEANEERNRMRQKSRER